VLRREGRRLKKRRRPVKRQRRRFCQTPAARMRSCARGGRARRRKGSKMTYAPGKRPKAK
jgi:hypothetical protein